MYGVVKSKFKNSKKNLTPSIICGILSVPYIAMDNFGLGRLTNAIWVMFMLFSWLLYVLILGFIISKDYINLDKINDIKNKKLLKTLTEDVTDWRNESVSKSYGKTIYIKIESDENGSGTDAGTDTDDEDTVAVGDVRKVYLLIKREDIYSGGRFFMVSIIVPVYNGEKYVKSCVDSLVNQTYKDIEIILVNDGSKDKTAEILDELKKKDQRIVVHHQKNLGVSTARNNGIGLAKGEYIMFCDCDDITEPDWCEELMKCTELYPDRLPMCWVKMVGPGFENGEWDYVVREDVNGSRLYNLYEKEDIMKLYDTGVIDNPVNKVYIADIIRKNKMSFDVNLSMGEDGLFNFRYLSYLGGKTVTVNKYLYSYIRQNENSLSRKIHMYDINTTESAYWGYLDLYKSIGIMSGESAEDLYKCFFQKYIDKLSQCISDSGAGKRLRIKCCKKLLWLPGFSECVKNVLPSKVYSRKLLKMAKIRPVLFVYSCVKILLI